MIARPCNRCGDVIPSGSHCTACRPPVPSARRRGYNTQHDKLSRRARALQPWCSRCGATEQLELDHAAETWERAAAGKTLTLADYRGVYCRDCNRLNGAARGAAGPRGDTRSAAEGDCGGSARVSYTSGGSVKP